MPTADDIFDRLARSTFRSRFHLGPRERCYALAKGRDATIDHARTVIVERLALESLRNDGRKTPMRDHSVFIAQHATACC